MQSLRFLPRDPHASLIVGGTLNNFCTNNGNVWANNIGENYSNSNYKTVIGGTSSSSGSRPEPPPEISRCSWTNSQKPVTSKSRRPSAARFPARCAASPTPGATPSPNTSRRCNRISRDKYGYTQGLFVAFRGGKCSALSLAAEEERHEGEALKNGAGLLANPRQAPVLAQPNVVPAKATCGWFCAAFAIMEKKTPSRYGKWSFFPQ